jgi:myosin heavy subunit
VRTSCGARVCVCDSWHLAASQEVAQYYQLYSADNFYYLNQSGCYTVPGVDDVKDYAEVLGAMKVLGFDQTEQNNIHGTCARVRCD